MGMPSSGLQSLHAQAPQPHAVGHDSYAVDLAPEKEGGAAASSGSDNGYDAPNATTANNGQAPSAELPERSGPTPMRRRSREENDNVRNMQQPEQADTVQVHVPADENVLSSTEGRVLTGAPPDSTPHRPYSAASSDTGSHSPQAPRLPRIKTNQVAPEGPFVHSRRATFAGVHRCADPLMRCLLMNDTAVQARVHGSVTMRLHPRCFQKICAWHDLVRHGSMRPGLCCCGMRQRSQLHTFCSWRRLTRVSILRSARVARQHAGTQSRRQLLVRKQRLAFASTWA